MYRRRINRRRRPFRRVRKSYRRKFSRRSFRRSDNVIMTKLKQYQTVSTNASGVLTGYLATYDASGTTNWANYTSMYDEFKVCAVKIKYIPIFLDAQMSLSPAGTNGNIFIVHDYDSTGASLSGTSIATMIGYNNCKVKQMLRPWSYYARVPKTFSATAGKPMGWLDTSVTAPQPGTIFYTSDTTINASTSIAHLVYTFYVKFSGKK